jgi:hypothetical protein
MINVKIVSNESETFERDFSKTLIDNIERTFRCERPVKFILVHKNCTEREITEILKTVKIEEWL